MGRDIFFGRTILRAGVVWAVVAGTGAAFFSDDNQHVAGPPLLRLGAGVRAAGLGGAFVGVADDASALAWNPAGITQLERKDLLLSQSSAFDTQQFQSIMYVHPFWARGDRRTLGLSMHHLDAGSFDLIREGVPVGGISPNETALAGSYAQAFGDVSWGVTGKWARQDLGTVQKNAVAVDAGVLGRWGDHGRWGVVVANAGPSVDYGPRRVPLPLVVRAGAGRRVMAAGHPLLLAAQLDMPRDEQARLRLGADYEFRFDMDQSLSVRFGYNGMERGWVWGGGVAWRGWRLNYAYVPGEGPSPGHQLDVGVRFGNPLRQEVVRRGLMDRAAEELLNNDTEAAQKTVDEVLALSPGHRPARALKRQMEERLKLSLAPETLFHQGQQAFAEHEYERASDLFKKLIIIQPGYPRAQEWLKNAQTRALQERERRLTQEIERTREAQRRDAVRRANQYMARRQWAAAIKAWEEARSLGADAQRGLSECQERLYDQGLSALQSGRWDEALAALTPLERVVPYRDTPELMKTARARREEDRRREALRLYTRGRDLFAQGRLTEARDHFEKALELTPTDITIQQALTYVAQELGQASPP